jgi:hypothetical protein
MRLRGGNALIALLSVAPGAACSTVDRDPIDECRDDIDCGTGLVCSLAQGNICVPEVLPPQTALGFDIRELDGVRIELTGCDPEVVRELGGSELRVQKRSSLVREYQLRASESRAVSSCNECEDTCDATALTCTAPADANLSLSMRSRLGIAPLVSATASYALDPELPEGELPAPVEFTWPSYESTSDPAASSAVVLQVTPPANTPPRSQYLRALAADAPVEIDTAALARCERAIIGPEGSVRTLLGTPISGATVEFFYAEPIASPVTVIGNGAACVASSDCPPGWACNAEGTCGLDLLGVLAGSTISLAEPAGALPPAYLYTYCEEVGQGEDLVRQLSVRVTPPDGSGLPTMIYDLAQTFPYPPAPGILTEINLSGGALCMPDWQPPMPVAFSVEGDPVTLIETELGTYTCCSTACLPSLDPGVEPTPPPQLDNCTTFKNASFETRWSNEEDGWPFVPCIPTGANSDGTSGTFVRALTPAECTPEGCSVMLTSGEIDELARAYTVSIEQPAESVFRSKHYYNVAVSAETDLLEFELEPRVLLRGQVVCVSTEKCSAISAVVAAERLRADTDEIGPLGPFEYQTRVDANGNFVMPVDPGLYVITAYPGVNEPGGPAPYQVIDLREGSPMLDDIDGVPNATLADPLELDDGVLVRVQLRDFPVSTKVQPLDIGSWKYQDDFPEDLDLNDPSTCLGTSTRGCGIRSLRPDLSLLLSGKFQFTARNRGGECPSE